MDPSLILSAFTAFTSVAAVIISVLTLRQNAKMIENSSRPYINIYGLSTYIEQRCYYIIIKNFGQSSAHVDFFSCDCDLKTLSYHTEDVPFSNIAGTTISPGQSYRAVIDFDKVTGKKLEYLHFSIQYSSSLRSYFEVIPLKIDANIGNLERHPRITHENSDAVLAQTLIDMHIKSL